jgi:hypothetical protein
VIRSSLVALAMVFAAGTAFAGDDIAPVQENLVNQHRGSGYTLRYPAGWRSVDPNANSGRHQGSDAVIVRGLGAEGSPTLVVDIENGETPLNGETRRTFNGMASRVASSAGGRAENVLVREESFNGRPGISVQFDFNFMGMGSITYKAILLPRDGRTYTLTCSAWKDRFRSVEQDFRAIVDSMEVTPRDPVQTWLLFGLVVGGVALVVFVLGKVLMGTSTPPPASTYRI